MRPTLRICFLLAIGSSVIVVGLWGLYQLLPLTVEQQTVYKLNLLVVGLAVGTIFAAKISATWKLEKSDSVRRQELIDQAKKNMSSLLSSMFMYLMIVLIAGTAAYLIYLRMGFGLTSSIPAIIAVLSLIPLFFKSRDLEPALPGPGRE